MQIHVHIILSKVMYIIYDPNGSGAPPQIEYDTTHLGIHR